MKALDPKRPIREALMSTRPGSIDAAIPPASWFRAGVIRIDDALGGAARCRHIALCQRGVGAFDGAAEAVPIAKIVKARMRIRISFRVRAPARDTALQQLAQQRCPTSVPVADLPASHSDRMGR